MGNQLAGQARDVACCFLMEQKIARAGFSPREFAEKFGKHPTWTYRLAYSGKIKVISDFGRLCIPASELDRILSAAKRYNPETKDSSNKELALAR
jgi:hypothetical protein